MSLAKTQPCVLFVEDDEALRTVFLILLRRLGIDVDVAESYASARAYLEENAITGLITDDALGDGLGTKLAEYAAQRNPNAIIALVSGSEPEIPDSLTDRLTILNKPFT